MRRQRGLSIAELLVAVVIGTLISLLAVTLLVSASTSYVAHTEAANLDDAGRFALSTLERAARQTGFADWERVGAAGGPEPAAPPPIMGLDAASLSSDTAGINDPRPAAVNGSDVLALRFAGSGDGGGDGSATTCAGFSVGAGQDGWSIFYVGNSARGEPELRCKYRGANGWSAEAVVAGVDSFQVLYGLDTDADPDGRANRYLTASAIDALGGGYWKRVASIKVSLVLHGAQRSKSVGGPTVYNLFGPAYSSAAGGDRGTRISKDDIAPALRDRVRRTFSSTILLRNQPR
jgi:type IV pilus assembly protein PilW